MRVGQEGFGAKAQGVWQMVWKGLWSEAWAEARKVLGGEDRKRVSLVYRISRVRIDSQS